MIPQRVLRVYRTSSLQHVDEAVVGRFLPPSYTNPHEKICLVHRIQCYYGLEAEEFVHCRLCRPRREGDVIVGWFRGAGVDEDGQYRPERPGQHAYDPGKRPAFDLSIGRQDALAAVDEWLNAAL